MVQEITINGESYYQIRNPLTNSVGDIFKDWRDIPAQKQKLYEQDARSAALRAELGYEKEEPYN